jgi:hypothetical protein
MSRRIASIRFDVKVGCLLLALLGSSCAEVARYSQQAGQVACGAFNQCTVYDDAGRHDVACFDAWGEESQVFADESGWPLSTTACPARPSPPPPAG